MLLSMALRAIRTIMDIPLKNKVQKVTICQKFSVLSPEIPCIIFIEVYSKTRLHNEILYDFFPVPARVFNSVGINCFAHTDTASKINPLNRITTISVEPLEVLQTTRLQWITLLVVQNGLIWWNCRAFAGRDPHQFDQEHSVEDSTSISWDIIPFSLNRFCVWFAGCVTCDVPSLP